MSEFQLPESRPSIEEVVTVKVDEHVCAIEFRRYGDGDDPYPLYDLDFSFDGGYVFLTHPRWWSHTPNRPPVSKLGVAKLLRLIRAVLGTLDEWGQRHPQSLITTSETGIGVLVRTLRRQGIISSGRSEQWLAYFNAQGQRVLFVGMLNLIEDKFTVNDLWRVAKDTEYYLGHFTSPVDWLKAILQSENDLDVL